MGNGKIIDGGPTPITRAPVMTYWTSRQHLVGSALALLGLALAVLDPVGPSGLLLVLGFYGVGVAASHSLERKPLAFDPVEADAALQAELAGLGYRLPPAIRSQVCRIKDILRIQLLPSLDALPLGSLDRYLVERTTVDYLPSAVSQYLRTAGLTQEGTDDMAAALRVLTDELALMEADMRRISSLIQQADLDRMLVQRRFLNERFGRLDRSG